MSVSGHDLGRSDLFKYPIIMRHSRAFIEERSNISKGSLGFSVLSRGLINIPNGSVEVPV